MRKVFLLSFLALSPLFIIGCGSQNASTDPAPTEAQPPAQLPEVAPPAAPETATNTAPKVTQVSAGLIPSTNAAVRSQSVAAGVRNDPFKGLATQPQIEIKQEPGSRKAKQDAVAASSPSVRIPLPSGRLSGQGSSPASQGSSPTSQGSSSAPGTPSSGTATQPSAPPAPPSTDLANAVEITGVVQTGQTTVAIVRAPDEPTSRNVQAGERLSNGQVLVKRISVGIAGSPVVVLEQNGVEVIRTLNNAPSFLG